MKLLIALSILSLSATALADNWKVVAETDNCSEKVKIKARSGEKYVIAVKGDSEEKLYSEDGAPFSKDSMNSTQFSSDLKLKRRLGEPTYTFINPSVVEANLPKLDVYYSGKKEHCRMVVK